MTGYDFLFTNDGRELTDTFQTIRESIEAMPPTKITFSTSDVVPAPTNAPISVDDMIRYFGAWKVPERFPGYENRGKKWINPDAKWAPKYSDVAVVCDCGAVRYTPEMRVDSETPYLEDKYSEACGENCPSDTMYETKAQIWKNRRQIIETAGTYIHPTKLVAKRLDVKPNNVQKIAHKLGYENYSSIQVQGYQLRRETWKRLMDEYGYLQREVAEIFGTYRSTVGDHIQGRPSYFQAEA